MIKVSIAILFMGVIYSDLRAQQNSLEYPNSIQVPSLQDVIWLSENPHVLTEVKKPFVVEFGGTWCPPCRKSIPELNKLVSRYKDDVQFVYIFLESNNTADTEDLTYIDHVKYFIAMVKLNQNIVVGVDNPSQDVRKHWDISGVPKAFVVQNGKIIFTGQPIDLDPVLKQLISGSLDSEDEKIKQASYLKACHTILSLNSDQPQLAMQKLDSLIQIYPRRKSALYYFKFDLLAKSDPKAAYEFLEWLINSDIPGFDWPHLVDAKFAQIPKNQRDYKLELKAIDKTIAESETTYYKAFPMRLKARTYDLMEEYTLATEAADKAVEYSKSTGGTPEARARYLIYPTLYKYKDIRQKQGSDVANRWLNTKLDNKSIVPSKYLIDAVLESDSSDNDLIIRLADDIIKNDGDLRMKLAVYNQKCDLLIEMNEFKSAHAVCTVALQESRKSGFQVWITKFETKLEEINKQIKRDQ